MSSATNGPPLPGSRKEKGIAANTPVRDYKLEPRFGDLPFLHLAAVAVLEAVGLRCARPADRGARAPCRRCERLNLDGLLALWHPPVSQ